MAMRWTPSLPGSGRVRFHSALARLPVLLLLLVLAPGCQKDDAKLLKPGDVVSNIVTAVYISPAEFHGNEVKMDGEAKDREWGGPLDVNRPFTQVRLTGENGAGDPGEPIYVSVKAIYNDTDIFFLFKWVDAAPNKMKDAEYYVGPDLIARTGPQPILLNESSWARSTPTAPRQDEDRLSIAFEMEPTGDALGTYAAEGCQVACHVDQTPSFGRPTHGRLDVWQWLACRTNEARNKYVDTDNANFPAYGIPGYMDDYCIDPSGGLLPDPGRACWFSNTLEGSNRPRWIYRPENDPFNKPPDPNSCFNLFGEDCRINNGLPTYYMWREDVERMPPELVAADTINNAVLPAGRSARKWRTGDAVTGFVYTYPAGSRADVRAKGAYDDKTQIWTLEVGRKLNTGDAFNDVEFAGAPGSEVVFTLAVADNSATRHWGSTPQVLRFGPKVSQARATIATPGNGVSR